MARIGSLGYAPVARGAAGGRVRDLEMDAADKELWPVAVHESGHLAVAEHFSLAPVTLVASASRGICCLDDSVPVEKFAAVGWAGVMAECLLDARTPCKNLPSVHLSKETLHTWYEQVRASSDYGLMSLRDEAAIKRWPVFDACRAAFDILSANLSYVRASAKLLLHEAKMAGAALSGGKEAEQAIEAFAAKHRQAQIERQWEQNRLAALAPLDLRPREWPATAEQFLRLVVAGGGRIDAEHAERFMRFAAHTKRIGGDSNFGDATWENEVAWRYDAVRYRAWVEEEKRTCKAIA
jgi:hypothetical protein